MKNKLTLNQIIYNIIVGASVLTIIYFLWKFILAGIALSAAILFYSIYSIIQVGKRRDPRILEIEKEFTLNKLKMITKDIFPYNPIARVIFINMFLKKGKEVLEPKEEPLCYEIFNITKEEFDKASVEDIKNIYRNLSKIYHPDKDTGDHDKMSLLNNCKRKMLKMKKD